MLQRDNFANVCWKLWSWQPDMIHYACTGMHRMPFLIISYQNITIKPYGALKGKIYSEVLKSNLFQIFRYHLKYCLWNISSLESQCLPIGVFQYWKTIWMKDSLTLVLSGGKLHVLFGHLYAWNPNPVNRYMHIYAQRQ